MSFENATAIYNKVKQQTNKSDEELQQIIEQIKSKYQGLLSDVGANIMLAKQLNVNLDLKKSTSSVVKINELNSSLDSVDLFARIKSIPPHRTYKAKDGGTGIIQAVYLSDSTGIIKLNLWNDKAGIIKELNLDKNDLVEIKDAYVTEYNNKVELSLRHGGQIIKDPQLNDGVNVPQIEVALKKLSDINDPIETPIDTIGRITNIYPAKTFEDKDQRQKKVINFQISDGNKTMKCVAWDLWSNEVETNFNRGDLIKLSDVIVKEGLYDLELYVNWNSTIIKDPKIDLEIPPLSQLMTNDYQEGKISDLENGKSYKLNGLIVAVNKNNLRFFKCPKCKERVYLINDEFICEACNEVVDPNVNMFGSINIDDGSGILKVTMFGDLVEKLFKINKNDLKKDITDDDKQEIFSYLEDELLGKKVTVCGRAKLNDFSSQIEMIASTIDLDQ